MEIRWDWIVDHLDDIAVAVWQHLVYTAIPLAVGFVISLGLAVWAVRKPWVYGPVTAITGILYTIPSLAAFALLIPFTGLTALTAFIPLTTYTLLILFRNIVAGFEAVPPEVLESADGMGYRSRERLLRVEIPLAVPLMFAGIRLAAVTLIGLATVVGILGSSFGGLGQLITEGLQTFFPTKYVAGGVLSVLLAFLVDFLLVRIERLATPWARARAAQAAPA
jgi:osmoprotectant transport system permease protein